LSGSLGAAASDSCLPGACSREQPPLLLSMHLSNVRFHNTGVKHFNHPVVGELHLNFNRLDLAADPGLTIFTYAAEPGSRSEEALRLLGSWAATVDPASLARRGD
jgi:hypothetical protein